MKAFRKRGTRCVWGAAMLLLSLMCGSVMPVEGQTIRKAPAPMYRDPVTDGAADPVVVWNNDSHSWWMLYTQRRANTEAADVAYCYGTQIGVAETTDNGQTWTYRGTLKLDFEKGLNTFWAPEIIYEGGKYHMFVSYIQGVRNHWGGSKYMEHYVSRDLWNWKHKGRVDLKSDAVIDAAVHRLPSGGWRMWYKDENKGSHIFAVDSKNLKDWSAPREVLSGKAQEGPYVFSYKGYFWMITDEWQGLRIYRSKDMNEWEKQGLILAEASHRSEDTPNGAHACVSVVDDTAYIFYFTHPGRTSQLHSFIDKNGVTPYDLRRSSIQVAPLQYKDGTLVCDHDSDFDFFLPDK